LPQNYWLVFCLLHYIVFKVLCPIYSRFGSFFRALLFAIFLRDSLFSIAIRVLFVNHFFDLFFSVLTMLDLVLHCTFLVLDYFTAFEIEKQVFSAQFFLRLFPSCISRLRPPQPLGFRVGLLLYICKLPFVALTSVRFLLYSI